MTWLLHQPAVTSVIIGAKSIEQLDDNLKTVEVCVCLSEDQLARLNEVSALPTEYPQWMLARQADGRLPRN